MHLGKFSTAAKEFLAIVTRRQVDARLNAMAAALQTQISNPQDPNQAQNFRNTYQAFLDAISSEEVRNAPPFTLRIWEDMGALKFIDQDLQARVAAILTANNVTPTLAFQEIQKVQAEFNQFLQALTQLDNGLTQLKVERDETTSGECEFAIGFPRTLVQERIDSLEKELHDLNTAIRHFEELGGEGVGSSRLRVIASTDWQFYLQMAPVVAACVAHALERIVQLYRSSLEITKLKLEIAKLKVASQSIPEEVFKPMQEFLNATIKAEIGKIANELVDSHYKGDEGRKNELTTGVRQAVYYMAERIDMGTTIQVIARDPKEPPTKDEKGNDFREQEKAKLAEAYTQSKQAVAQINRQGRVLARSGARMAPTLQLDRPDAEK